MSVFGMCLATLLAFYSDLAAEPQLTGVTDARLQGLDEVLTTFVRNHKVPGAALAIAYHGRLVYARGCGWADIDQQRPVQPDSVFRIASLSKPITSVAILQLVERGQLEMDASILNYLSDSVPLTQMQRDSHPWSKITIRHCLQHLGGWDWEASYDPMFHSIRIARELKVPRPPSSTDIIRYMSSQPLDFTPGEKYAYSNFGYNILGRVIEKVSGQSYADYVQAHVWRPLHATSPRLGKTLLEDRLPGEVLYYPSGNFGQSAFTEEPQMVIGPYGRWCLEAMDSHGGWTSSAIDLVRFAAALDTSPKISLFKPETRQTFIDSRPPLPVGVDKDGQPLTVYYGYGWNVRLVKKPGQANLWHHGSLDGSSTLMAHRHDDINYAILINSRRLEDSKSPSIAIDNPLYKAISEIKEWPETDLFPTTPRQ